MGSFMGSLSTVPATKIGAAAIKGALDKIQLDSSEVDEVLMGNVIQAGNGAIVMSGGLQHSDDEGDGGMPDEVKAMLEQMMN